MSSLFWCNTCKIPVFTNYCRVCNSHLKDKIPPRLKPVFKEEFKMYASMLEVSDALRLPKILYHTRNRLISDVSAPKAHYILKFQVPDHDLTNRSLLIKRVSEYKRSRYRKFPFQDEEYLTKLFMANLEHLEKIENEALQFIEETIEENSDLTVSSSFSGGKDSSVTAFLVNKVEPKQLVIFSDTGIEYPETIEYVKNYGSKFGKLKMLEQKNDFYELVDILGPPSRMMRWCCSTQKATPINRFQHELNTAILSFDGIRREESALRQGYERVRDNTKMIKQISAYPILDWSEFEVWLYILWRKIPFNPLYRKGYSRIGCYPCPNNGAWDNFLMAYYHPEIANSWYQKIRNFSLNITGKEDDFSQIINDLIIPLDDTTKEKRENDDENWSYDETWVDEDRWKGRRVKYDNDIIGFSFAEINENENDDNKIENIEEFKPCNFDNSLIINLDRSVEGNVEEFLKPFGKTTRKTIGKEHIIVAENKNYKITLYENSKRIKITYENNFNIAKKLKLIIRQLNKSLNCINCGACIGSCPYGAISVNPHFKISEDKCSNCLTCTGTKYLKFSCVALHYKSERILIRKNKEKEEF